VVGISCKSERAVVCYFKSVYSTLLSIGQRNRMRSGRKMYRPCMVKMCSDEACFAMGLDRGGARSAELRIAGTTWSPSVEIAPPRCMTDPRNLHSIGRQQARSGKVSGTIRVDDTDPVILRFDCQDKIFGREDNRN